MTVAGTALLLFLFLFVTAIQGGLDRVLSGARRPAHRLPGVPLLPEFEPAPGLLRRRHQGRAGGEVGAAGEGGGEQLPGEPRHGRVPRRRPEAVLPAVRPNLSLVAGDWPAFQARTDAALVGRRIAERRGLRPGQSFTVAGVTVQVAGVFTSDAHRRGERDLHAPCVPAVEPGRRTTTTTRRCSRFSCDDPRPGARRSPPAIDARR